MALTTDELSLARQVAYGAKRRYGPYADVDDVQQQLSLWMLERLDRVREWRDVESGGAQLRRSLERAAWKYCEAEKAERVGYGPDDNSGYGTGALRELLPLALNDDWYTVDGVEGKPHTALAAQIMDVRRGLSLVGDPHAFVLSVAVDSGWDYDYLARVLGGDEPLTYDAARQRTSRAVRRLAKVLNEPQERDPYKDIPRYCNADILGMQMGMGQEHDNPGSGDRW